MKHENRAIETVYENIWDAETVEGWLYSAKELQPRSPASLFEIAAELGLTSESLVLDAGCGEGSHTCRLATHFDAHIIGLDPLESNLGKLRQQVEQQQLTEQVTAKSGTLEALPFPDEMFSFVWCRGVIPHLSDIRSALQECIRVLTPGASMLIQTGFATARLSAKEEEELCHRLGFVAASLSKEQVEQAFQELDCTVIYNDSFSSEYAEFYEEREGRCAKYLVGLARLLRSEEEVIERFGRQAYETTLGVFHWQLYQMMGKISYHVYGLRKN